MAEKKSSRRGGKAPPPVSDTDRALFRQAVRDATPLPAPDRRPPEPRRPPPIPLQHLADERQAVADSLSDHIPWEDAMESGEELIYLRSGLDRQILRKLRRGHWVVEAELDLHGHTSAEARPQLSAFLDACRLRDVRCVRIIHGKGLRSPNKEPVLKVKVKHWLMQREDVLAFCQARAVDGGSGAALVLLKASGGG